MKKIVVCGCSFSSPVGGKYTGTHWAEILATKMNAELVVLARQGVSNNVIRLQIDEAVKHNPDWIFINATTPDRIELPVYKDSSKEYTSYVSFEDSAYNPATGLKNFNYPGHDNVMISETIFSIIDWPTHPYRDRPLSAEIKFAVKSYAACLYDLNWKTQCDNWIIASGLWDLHDRGISFLYNPWVLNTNRLLHGLHKLPAWFVEKYVLNQDFDFYKVMREYKPNVDPGYHTSAEGQMIIANNYFNRISG